MASPEEPSSRPLSFERIRRSRRVIVLLACGPLMKERYAVLQHVEKGPLLAPLQQKIASASDPVEKQHYSSDLSAMQWMYQAIDRVTLAYPTELLGQANTPKKIDLGGLTVLIEHHVGHTPTDLVVRVPQRDIVFTLRLPK